MDWSKAKTILIVAFLITNILLVSVLISNESHMDTTVSKEFIEDAVKLLKTKDIFVDIQIPREIPSLNSLIVEYEIIDIAEINKEFFLNEGLISSDEPGLIKISKDKEYVSIENNKILIYENKNLKEEYQELTKEISEDIVLNFLKSRFYDVADMKLSYVEERNGEYHIMFSKLYKEKYVETAYVNAVVDSRGVKRLERVWLNTKNEGEIPIYINTAPKSMLNLLSMEESYGKTIIDMSLCYYFDPDGHEYIKEPQEAKKGKAIPAWRVVFDDGTKVIIDNY